MSTLLTGAEVAQRLGVSKPHVYKLWDSGKLPCVLIPGISKRKMRRISAEALEEWILQHTHANGSAQR
ncbi:MAG TPA: helix-turn-helix domain-containing protein [Candidatus Rubrimentiphilum sp.]|nr:helix-turn-helix domain-containing protein [Candidatus Rubrimentiphilum sp.]